MTALRPQPPHGLANALTIDVEDYFQVEAYASVVPRSRWGELAARVEWNTQRLLRLLDDCRAKATFFVLGWVADRYPELIRRIAEAGHELASHGFWHRLTYHLSPAGFREDLCLSLAAIRAAAPRAEICGYRAPSFSITPGSQWALDILQELGFQYDASVFPVRGHDLYGFPGAPRFAYRVRPGLCEIPPSTVRWLGRNWPVAGGGYFRLLPLWLTCRAIRAINAEGQPAVVYVHPWELDPDQPRIRQAPLRSRFRHRLNLARTEGRLRALLERFAFGPIQDVFRAQLASAVHPTTGESSNGAAQPRP
jgi:polysaccharide deacetylase family protein (PEP-CTERM system associated)